MVCGDEGDWIFVCLQEEFYNSGAVAVVFVG